MKAKIEEKPGFVPFDLTITVESEGDACYLWHLFNMADSVVEKNVGARKVAPGTFEGKRKSDTIWIEIDKLMRERGIDYRVPH